jgi:CheY-like chemotaxis protein
MDGYEATRQIRQINKKSFIIAQTASLEGDEKQLAGCDHLFQNQLTKQNYLH